MPIFAYRCDQCGFEKDVLQKRSDPPLTDCPSCGQSAFRKQLAAPSFQLKGSGWYVTDFRDKGKKAGGDADASSSSSSASAGTSGSAAASTEAAPAPASAPAAAPAPSASAGDSGAKAA